jgi:hypothetical protein
MPERTAIEERFIGMPAPPAPPAPAALPAPPAPPAKGTFE